MSNHILFHTTMRYILHNKKLMSVINGVDAFNSSMTGVTCGAGTANHSEVPVFTPDF